MPRSSQATADSARLCNRLVEEADFRAAQELFGGQDLDKMQPKSAKDFEDFAATLAHKYVLGHSRSPHYKALVKALFKVGCMPQKHCSTACTKDYETPHCIDLTVADRSLDFHLMSDHAARSAMLTQHTCLHWSCPDT